MSKSIKYEAEEIISFLKEISDKIGHSPSRSEYMENKKEHMPAYGTIRRRFGSWNKAKEAAGLEKHLPETEGRPAREKPKYYSMTEDEWENLSSKKRYRLRKRSKIYEVKKESGCEWCGYNGHPSSLDFHHPDDNKSSSVGDLINTGSWEDIRKEIDKCVVICSNCHREYTHKEQSLYSWEYK